MADIIIEKIYQRPVFSWGAGNLIICKVVMMHINKGILNAEGLIDPQKIDLAARMSENYWCRAHGDAVFAVEKPLPFPAMGIDSLPESVRNSRILTGNDLGKLGNIEAFPTEESKSIFKEKEGLLLMDKIKSADDLHRAAQKLLAEGEKEKAINLLLMGEALFG